MKTMKIATIALLIAALPIAPAAFASDRGHDDRRQGRPDQARGHDYGHDRHGYRGHNYRHHYRHGHHGYQQNTGYYSQGGHRAQVVLPFPPLPPFPVIVLNKIHHDARVVLRRPY
jgi:hypothetical protein